MSPLRNAIPRRAHKERAQPQLRKKFGLLEKHKDYVVHAKAYHKKEETIRRLKEKAAFRNLDEFYFKMIKTKTVDGVHRLESEANKYTQEELMLMKTQDIGYILQKLLSERNGRGKRNKIYIWTKSYIAFFDDIPDHIKRKTAASYRELGREEKESTGVGKAVYGYVIAEGITEKGPET